MSSVAATNKRISHVNGQCAEANKLGTASEMYMTMKARVISGFLVFIGV